MEASIMQDIAQERDSYRPDKRKIKSLVAQLNRFRWVAIYLEFSPKEAFIEKEIVRVQNRIGWIKYRNYLNLS